MTLSAAAPGQMQEMTFNAALAEALRQRRRLWREHPDSIIAERSRMLIGEERRRPDIVVMPPDIYPVIIEVEFGDPAIADARRRLGREVAGTPDRVRSAIAIGAPAEAQRWSDAELHRRLAQPDAVTLKLALLSANVQGGGQVTDIEIWPATGSINVNVEDLAVLCEYSAAPQTLVSREADRVAGEIHGIADLLLNALERNVSDEITRGLGQQNRVQGLRLACCIWLTSLRLHSLLALKSEKLKAQGLKTVAELKTAGGGIVTLAGLRDEWDKILDVNYGAIFRAARDALHDRIPAAAGADVIERLSAMSDRIAGLRLGNRVDFAGELFPKLLDDREETAAHYTLPETAELLARLAVARLDLRPLGGDWTSPETVANLRLADLACGTGSLLRAAYRHIRSRHEAAGGRAAHLHRAMIEQGLTGLDINPLAAHMTAAGLSSAEIETEYHRANIAAVAVLGGKTGSLELLEQEQVTDVTGESVTGAAATRSAPANIPVPHNAYDLVIQNPPYSRARADRKMFDVTGITEQHRQRSNRRLAQLRRLLAAAGNEMPHGQAGMGADFSALAHRKLKPGGVFASVLPLTAAHAESWAGFRKTIEREYRDITAIAFTANERGAMLSADTFMGEMLLIAVKGDSGPNKPPLSPILCINLSDIPASVAEAYWFAGVINAVNPDAATSGVIAESGSRIGSWTSITPLKPGFPWFAVGMQNQHLVSAVAQLLDGRLYSPADRQSWQFSLPVTTLDQLAATGPTHHLVGHIRDAREKIGAFTFDPIKPGEIPIHPALWVANHQTQRRILVSPTHEGQPVSGRDDELTKMLAQRSTLFISRGLRMTSQALAAARIDYPVMGGASWNALQTDDDSVKAALAIWLNSTLSLIIRTAYAQTTQQGRASMQINALGGFPVPDFAADSDAGAQARAAAARRWDELAGLELAPASYAFRDANRHRLDAAALELLGLGGNPAATNAVTLLRDLWCREPSVHGGNQQIMAALAQTLRPLVEMQDNPG